MRTRFSILFAVVAMIAWAPWTSADPITFQAYGTNPDPGSLRALSASATFAVVDGRLQIKLTNTSLDDVLLQSDVLTAVFWGYSGTSPGALTPYSAVLATGSTVLWILRATRRGCSRRGMGVPEPSIFSGTGTGIGRYCSAGFQVFGTANFPGSNLDGTDAVNGLNYGITSLYDNPNTPPQPPPPGGPVTGSIPLIKNSVVFTLSGIPSNFNPAASITNVYFWYGTGTQNDEPQFGPLVPCLPWRHRWLP